MPSADAMQVNCKFDFGWICVGNSWFDAATDKLCHVVAQRAGDFQELFEFLRFSVPSFFFLFSPCTYTLIIDEDWMGLYIQPKRYKAKIGIPKGESANYYGGEIT